MYKIKINCTHKNDLTFNYKKIDRFNVNRITKLFKPDTIDYVNKIIILYKTSLYDKKLELQQEYKIKSDNKQLILSLCKRDLTPQELCDFDYNYKQFDKYNREKIIRWICNYNLTNTEINNFMDKYKIYKNKRISKTLEFLCNRELTEDEFKTFIDKMKTSYFKSKNDKLSIQFIRTDTDTHEIIHNLLFNSCNKPPPIEKYHNIKNTSKYATYIIYNK
jgi:hypothetical protein